MITVLTAHFALDKAHFLRLELGVGYIPAEVEGALGVIAARVASFDHDAWDYSAPVLSRIE